LYFFKTGFKENTRFGDTINQNEFVDRNRRTEKIFLVDDSSVTKKKNLNLFGIFNKLYTINRLLRELEMYLQRKSTKYKEI
jgi:hypothetical protein